MTTSRSSALNGMDNDHKFVRELKTEVQGHVRDDEATKIVYRVDASIFQVEPVAVFTPLSKQDVVQAIKVAREYNIPVIPRGAATGITGGCLGRGLVIDCSRYLNRILEINIREGFARVEPGVIQDDLNRELKKHGFRLGPETSTGNRATLGGMLANNAAGSESLFFGAMVDCILEVELALSTGELTSLHAERTAKIREKYREDILKHFPKTPRNSSGYRLDKFLDNPAAIIAGSEGTLGVITEMKVKIVPEVHPLGIALLEFPDLVSAFEYVPEILKHSPLSLELIDDHILEAAKQSRTLKQIPLKTNPKAVLIAGFTKESPYTLIKDPEIIKEIKNTRKGGLGLLLSKRGYSRAIAFIEDLSIPPGFLAPFIRDFQKMLASYNKTAGIYGHAGSGCLHIRPYMDLRSFDEQTRMRAMMEDSLKLVLKYGGVMSGEHGDGLIRSAFNRKLYGETLYNAFCEIKAAYDPLNLMNPGKIVGTPKENFRSYPNSKIETFFDFSREGGFELSADLCNGNAECRKKEGVMCPSFQATQNEYDTTRARAEMLRATISQKNPVFDDKVQDVLELCLMCKGCKKECPSQVDMAKMKSEVLYQAGKWSLKRFLFGHIPAFLRFFSPKRFRAQSPANPQVVLFNDTFNQYLHPKVGHSALKVLEHHGFSVVVPPYRCCGRTLISKGYLEGALKKSVQLIEMLSPYAENKLPIVGLEPSCILTLRDETLSLISKHRPDLLSKAKAIAECAVTFEEFFAKVPLKIKKPENPILLHTHCHEMAEVGRTPARELLKRINASFQEVQEGCCGMAGSFGYEHKALSLKIAGLKLFPALQKASHNTIIVANGTSCRSQIHRGKKNALHMAEVLEKNLL